jgi:hypothetical protein
VADRVRNATVASLVPHRPRASQLERSSESRNERLIDAGKLRRIGSA